MTEPIKVSAYCVVEKNGKLMLTENVGKKGWKLPGGELKRRETVLNAVKRGVFEETGLNIDINGMVSVQEYISDKGDHRMRVYVSGKVKSGNEVRNKAEVKKLVWLTREELARVKEHDFYLQPFYKAVRDFLDRGPFPLILLRELNL